MPVRLDIERMSVQTHLLRQLGGLVQCPEKVLGFASFRILDFLKVKEAHTGTPVYYPVSVVLCPALSAQLRPPRNMLSLPLSL